MVIRYIFPLAPRKIWQPCFPYKRRGPSVFCQNLKREKGPEIYPYNNVCRVNLQTKMDEMKVQQKVPINEEQLRTLQGLQDGIFLNKNFEFGYILKGLKLENVCGL
jgi:hypothetical protein